MRVYPKSIVLNAKPRSDVRECIASLRGLVVRTITLKKPHIRAIVLYFIQILSGNTKIHFVIYIKTPQAFALDNKLLCYNKVIIIIIDFSSSSSSCVIIPMLILDIFQH